MPTAKKAQRYRKYLQSDEWKALRKLALERACHRCQLCNADGFLHVHHRTYERIYKETLDDLTVLCATCHRRFHDKGRKGERGERRKEIDAQILQIVERAGVIAWRDVQRQIKAPRAQSWARANRMLKAKKLAWKDGKLCLYRTRDLV